MRACDAAVEVLRFSNNPAVMWGDSGLLHAIANRANLACRSQAWVTEARVLAALSRTPGELVPGYTLGKGRRRVRIFRLPEHATAKQ